MLTASHSQLIVEVVVAAGFGVLVLRTLAADEREGNGTAQVEEAARADVRYRGVAADVALRKAALRLKRKLKTYAKRGAVK